MKERNTVIIYASYHHGNTKKVVDAIASKHQVETIDIIANKDADISGYDRIGIAAGIAFSKYYPQMIEYLENHFPEGKEVFFIHTAGAPKDFYKVSAEKITVERGAKTLGVFCCKGFDTYGPFKLIGGINKKSPTEEDLEAAAVFYEGLGE